MHNCCTTLDRLNRDHCAVSLDLNLISIKYKAKSPLNCGDIDWREMCEEDEQRKLFKKYLLQLTSRDMSYEKFCEAVVGAGKITATIINCKCEGWYRASKDILAHAIKKNLHHLLYDSSNLSPEEIADIKMQLKLINKRNHDLVELEKACWYKGLCDKIHKMNMDPWLAWENIHILTGGKTAHHTTNLNMSMRLENSELASNARKNMSVFGVHFHKVLNNHRPVNTLS